MSSNAIRPSIVNLDMTNYADAFVNPTNINFANLTDRQYVYDNFVAIRALKPKNYYKNKYSIIFNTSGEVGGGACTLNPPSTLTVTKGIVSRTYGLVADATAIGLPAIEPGEIVLYKDNNTISVPSYYGILVICISATATYMGLNFTKGQIIGSVYTGTNILMEDCRQITGMLYEENMPLHIDILCAGSGSSDLYGTWQVSTLTYNSVNVDKWISADIANLFGSEANFIEIESKLDLTSVFDEAAANFVNCGISWYDTLLLFLALIIPVEIISTKKAPYALDEAGSDKQVEFIMEQTGFLDVFASLSGTEINWLDENEQSYLVGRKIVIPYYAKAILEDKLLSNAVWSQSDNLMKLIGPSDLADPEYHTHHRPNNEVATTHYSTYPLRHDKAINVANMRFRVDGVPSNDIIKRGVVATINDGIYVGGDDFNEMDCFTSVDSLLLTFPNMCINGVYNDAEIIMSLGCICWSPISGDIDNCTLYVPNQNDTWFLNMKGSLPAEIPLVQEVSFDLQTLDYNDILGDELSYPSPLPKRVSFLDHFLGSFDPDFQYGFTASLTLYFDRPSYFEGEFINYGSTVIFDNNTYKVISVNVDNELVDDGPLTKTGQRILYPFPQCQYYAEQVVSDTSDACGLNVSVADIRAAFFTNHDIYDTLNRPIFSEIPQLYIFHSSNDTISSTDGELEDYRDLGLLYFLTKRDIVLDISEIDAGSRVSENVISLQSMFDHIDIVTRVANDGSSSLLKPTAPIPNYLDIDVNTCSALNIQTSTWKGRYTLCELAAASASLTNMRMQDNLAVTSFISSRGKINTLTSKGVPASYICDELIILDLADNLDEANHTLVESLMIEINYEGCSHTIITVTDLVNELSSIEALANSVEYTPAMDELAVVRYDKLISLIALVCPMSMKNDILDSVKFYSYSVLTEGELDDMSTTEAIGTYRSKMTSFVNNIVQDNTAGSESYIKDVMLKINLCCSDLIDKVGSLIGRRTFNNKDGDLNESTFSSSCAAEGLLFHDLMVLGNDSITSSSDKDVINESLITNRESLMLYTGVSWFSNAIISVSRLVSEISDDLVDICSEAATFILGGLVVLGQGIIKYLSSYFALLGDGCSFTVNSCAKLPCLDFPFLVGQFDQSNSAGGSVLEWKYSSFMDVGNFFSIPLTSGTRLIIAPNADDRSLVDWALYLCLPVTKDNRITTPVNDLNFLELMLSSMSTFESQFNALCNAVIGDDYLISVGSSSEAMLAKLSLYISELKENIDYSPSSSGLSSPGAVLSTIVKTFFNGGKAVWGLIGGSSVWEAYDEIVKNIMQEINYNTFNFDDYMNSKITNLDLMSNMQMWSDLWADESNKQCVSALINTLIRASLFSCFDKADVNPDLIRFTPASFSTMPSSVIKIKSDEEALSTQFINLKKFAVITAAVVAAPMIIRGGKRVSSSLVNIAKTRYKNAVLAKRVTSELSSYVGEGLVSAEQAEIIKNTINSTDVTVEALNSIVTSGFADSSVSNIALAGQLSTAVTAIIAMVRKGSKLPGV